MYSHDLAVVNSGWEMQVSGAKVKPTTEVEGPLKKGKVYRKDIGRIVVVPVSYLAGYTRVDKSVGQSPFGLHHIIVVHKNERTYSLFAAFNPDIITPEGLYAAAKRSTGLDRLEINLEVDPLFYVKCREAKKST